MNISDYTKRLGIDTSPTVAPLDIEAGKAGYTQYLADIESFKKAQEETQASVEASKSWWDKASDFILRANGMSSQMSDNPISSGFNAAVEAYKNIPEDNKPSDDWTDEERWAFGEKYAKDKNEAYSFAEKLNNDKANAKKAKQSEKVSKWATRNGVNRTLASMGSLGINAAFGGMGFYDALAQKAAGRDTFVNHGVLLPHEATNAMQGAIADYKNKKWGTLNENIPIIGGKGVGDAYQLRQSILQSALSGSGEGALFQFFGMAASQGVSDALSRGATSDQALAMGVVSGLAEAIPEMISVDKFVGMASAEGVQNLFKNILEQAGQEAGEEFTTSVINELADAWIMGGKSNYNQTVNALIASGMSPEQAKNRALVQTLENLAYDVLSGAISGGVSGAGATGISRVNQQFLQTEANARAKEALTPESKKLIEEGKKYDTTKKRAEALEKKLADGKELSGYDLRMLANQVSEASRNADVDTLRKAIIERMKAEGVSDSRAKVLGEIALNKAIGNEVSKVQDLMLQRDTSAMKVYNQMSEDMMKSRLGDSAWAENTPLEKLRAEKHASEQTTSEQRVQSGIDRLKADIAATYGVDTKEYKINTESLEGKIEKIDGGYAYKKSSADSKIHTEGITSPLTEQDIAELSAIEKIANELGIDIHVYETTVDKNGERSYVDKEGKRTSDSGYYDPNDNSIHIDLRAGENGEGTMLYTASHEVVHFIKENAPEHYDALEALVTKELVKGGYSIDKLIDEQRKKLIESEKQKLIEDGVDPNTMSAEAFENLARERIGETNLENIAREEMIAEACLSFLASKNAASEIKALKTKNKGLWTALKKFFTSLFAKISNVYKTVPPDSAQGKYIADMRKAVKPIRDAFMEGAVEAAKNAAQNKSEVYTQYTQSLEAIYNETFSSDKNTHIKVLNSTPKIYIDKADASDRSIEMSWDIAYLAMKKSGNIKGNYHGLGVDVMKALPQALEDPLYIVKQKNGRIAAVTEIVVKGKRAVFASIELEAYQTVKKDGKTLSDTYNLIVTVTDAKPNYLQNTIFSGDVVYNKNQEDPSHFILRLKSLNKALPTYDREGSSKVSIAQSEKEVKTVLKKSRATSAQDSTYFDAVKRGDMETAQKMVDEAAKANGYTDKLYHGTKQFGFTEFDPKRSGVRDAIFLTDDHRIAQTYSGRYGKNSIYSGSYINQMSDDDMVKTLEDVARTHYNDAQLKYTPPIYKIFNRQEAFNFTSKTISELVELKEYAEKRLSDKTLEESERKRLASMVESIKSRKYNEVAKLAYYQAIDESGKQNVRIKKISQNIRLMSSLTSADLSKPFVLEMIPDGFDDYLIRFISFEEARSKLRDEQSRGNYAIYGNPGKQLVVDAKGAKYDEINLNGKLFTTDGIAKVAKANGYDSVLIKNVFDNGKTGQIARAGNVYVYFNPNDLKSADTITYDDNGDIIPLSERFNEKSKDIRHKSRTRTYSQGQAAALKANLSHQKVYTKSTAMKFVKAVAPGIKTKTFDELSNELWIGLNTYTALEDKQAFAKDMADMLVERMLVDTEVKSRKWDEAVEKIAYLKPAINTIKFREEDLPDLEHMLDKNGLRSLRARWGYKSKEGEHKRAYGLDEFISDLSREMPGMAYLADMHPTEAMVEVDKLYEKLKETISQRYESAYEDATEEQIERWKSTVEGKILDVYEYYGGMSKLLQAMSSTSEAVDTYLGTVPEGTTKPEKYFVDILKQMDERISFWKAEKSKTEQISKWNGVIGNKAAEIRDYKNGAFLNATQYHPDIFKESIEQLTKVTWRGNISPKGVRKIFAELKQWYTMENPMLYNKDNDDNLYSDQIAFYIDILAADADVEKPLAADEYPMIYEVMNHLYTMMKNYGKIFRAGRWVDAAEIAKAYIGIIDENDNKRTAWTRAQSLYNRQFLEPMALARQADNYNPDGFFTQTMEELRRASINASIGEMRLRKQYDAFVDANQKYLMNAAKETVRYRGYDIPRLHLISLYMSMKRKQSREGLALNGFEYTMKTAWWDSEDVIKVPGYLPQSEKYNTELINRATEEQMKIIAENFTDTDRQYISILEKLFNEELRKLKIERDMERQGYTNALEGYYYPIIRGGIAKNIDTAKFTDVNRATNSSFNKSTQQHAQQYLKIISADAMVNRHIKDMCKYYYMSQAIENYNVLYQIDTTEGEPNLNNPRNIAERLKVSKVWEKDYDYFKKLVADIQGIRDNQYDSDGWRLIESLRGNYAKFALGLNAKVLFTQASSIIAAGDVIGFGSLMSLKKNVGLIATKEDIEKYCPIAAVRSYEQTALKAMTLTDKMGKVSEKMMAGISVMDDLVIRRLFAACQVEAKKRGAGDIGTEDNKIVAGKILEQIILETQQNSYATEKSSAMRSANPLWRGLTMFTADGMKIISRIHDAVGEFKLAKKSGNAAEIKAARKHLARSIAVATAISVYMTAIASLFNWIYGRKKKDEEEKPLMKVHNFTTELIGNFIGALPFISDLYDRIVNGFEVEDVFYDSINNLYGSISNLYKDATDMVDGKKDRTVEDLNRDLRTLLYAVGQVTGMPVRNVYNLTRGAIGIASPKAGYYIDSKFENTSLVTDLKKAVKEGNNSKTAYIMGLIYDERLDDRVSKEQSEEILRLYEKIGKKEIEGYTVIPKDIPDEIKRDGVTVELTDSQKEKIVSEYSKVISAIDKLISSSFYRAQSDENRAYLIDYYHDKYYETAVNNALGIKDDKVAVYNAIGFSTYAKFAYVTRGIQSDKDKHGNTIPGSKKAKVTEAIEKASKDENKKLLYLASLGYTLTEEQRKKLCKYLNSLSVSASKKKSLAEACNLTYKNGKIYP